MPKVIEPKRIIYLLRDPRTKRVRYVGCCLKRRQSARYWRHLKDFDCNEKKSEWIKSLITLGLKPEMEVLEEVVGSWEEREIHWIAHYSKEPLLNMTLGGKGPLGSKKSPETLAKIKLYKPTEDVKRRISKAHKGKKFSEEHKKNLSKSKKGVPLTEKQKSAIAEAVKKNPQCKARYRKGEANGRAIVNDQMVIEARRLKGKVPISELASRYGLSYSAMKRLLNGTTWSHVS